MRSISNFRIHAVIIGVLVVSAVFRCTPDTASPTIDRRSNLSYSDCCFTNDNRILYIEHLIIETSSGSAATFGSGGWSTESEQHTIKSIAPDGSDERTVYLILNYSFPFVGFIYLKKSDRILVPCEGNTILDRDGNVLDSLSDAFSVDFSLFSVSPSESLVMVLDIWDAEYRITDLEANVLYSKSYRTGAYPDYQIRWLTGNYVAKRYVSSPHTAAINEFHNPLTGQDSVISSSYGAFAWLTGDMVTCADADSIYCYDLNNGILASVAPYPGIYAGMSYYSAVSNDGRYFVFAWTGGGSLELYSKDAGRQLLRAAEFVHEP